MEAAAPLPRPLPFLDGREPSSRALLGSLLLRERHLTAERLEQALAEKDATGGRLGEIVVGRGWVQPSALAGLLAEQHGLEYLDLAKAKLDPTATTLRADGIRLVALGISSLDEIRRVTGDRLA